MGSRDPVDLGKVKVLSESAKAIQVEREDGSTLWVPKSVLHDDSEVFEADQDGKLVVLEWFAEKEGLE